MIRETPETGRGHTGDEDGIKTNQDNKGRNRMKNKDREPEMEKEEKRQGILDGIGNAAQFALFTGACAGTGALLGAAAYFYKLSLTPKKNALPGESDPAGKEIVEGARWLREHPLREEAYLRADDGLQLHAVFIPAPRSSADSSAEGTEGGTEEAAGQPGAREEHRYAICVHGYGDTAEIMGIYARTYRDRYGMHVLVPELRGHGRSDGDYVGMGYDDSRDLLRWIDWILERDHGAQIVLHGISMGAAAVLMTTGHTLPDQVAAVVADSSYTTAVEEMKYVYRTREKAVIPAGVLMEAVRGIALVRAGYDVAKAAPVKAVARSKTPTLFIHGQEDDFIPPAMMTELYRAASCPKSFQWIPDAGHVQSVVVDPETYWARIERFLHAYGVALF